MRATGIIRRIDDLGRVVIPKETRKYIGIGKGALLEIFVDDEGIILRKYEPSIGLRELVRRLYNEFLNIRNDMDLEKSNEIFVHIQSLQQILDK